MTTVAFLGEVRKAVGRSTVDLEAETVGGLLTAMASPMGPGLAGFLTPDGSLQQDVEVLVNGRNIEFLERLETRLRPTDRITIFSSGVRGFPGG